MTEVLLQVLRLLLGGTALAVAGAVGALSLGLGVNSDDNDGAEPVERQLLGVVVAIGIGAGIVPTFAFFIHLFLGPLVSFPLVIAVAGAFCMAADRWAVHSCGSGVWARLPPRRWWQQTQRGTRLVLLASLGVGLLYFLKYDRSLAFNESCIHTTALMATGHAELYARLLLENVQDARLGNTGLLAGFVALFQQLGFRVLYAVCGLLLALGGWLVGWACTGTRAGAWFGLLLLSLNPYIAGIPLLDENLLTVAFASPAIVLLLSRRPLWFATGAFFALAVTMRHVLVLALPAVLFIVWSAPQRRSALFQFITAFFLLTLPENIHHDLALGTPLAFESNPQFPAFPYSVAGLDFMWQGLLGWPFHDTMVRTPGNPFPTLVMWPLAIADHLGVALFGAMVVGFVTAWRSDRRWALFWLLWWAPVQASLSVQEAWDVPNKMGVIVVVFASFLAWTLHGLTFAVRRPRIGVPLIAAVACGAVGAASAIESWRAPIDERYYTVHPSERFEYGPRVDDRAARATSLGVLPDFGRLDRFGTFLSPAKLLGLGRDFQQPRVEAARRPWGWFPGETPSTGPPVLIELDLSRALYGRSDFLRLIEDDEGAEAPVFDTVTGPGLQIVRRVNVPWDQKPVMVYAARSADVTVLQLFFADSATQDTRRPFADTDGEEQCKLFSLLAGLPGQCEQVRYADHDPERARLLIRVPAGAISVASTVNRSAQTVWLWRGEVSPGGVALEKPVEPWHN